LYNDYQDSHRRSQNFSNSIQSCCNCRSETVGQNDLGSNCFTNIPYVSLENPDTRTFAIEDPRGFLNQYKDGAIFDEAQRVPDLFSYLQQVLDENPKNGRFILTGSNNFLLQENISQSLAGRIGPVHYWALPNQNN
jgi:predicted AAA+ superfamily ATPase